jgi:hypothetical protein
MCCKRIEALTLLVLIAPSVGGGAHSMRRRKSSTLLACGCAWSECYSNDKVCEYKCHNAPMLCTHLDTRIPWKTSEYACLVQSTMAGNRTAVVDSCRGRPLPPLGSTHAVDCCLYCLFQQLRAHRGIHSMSTSIKLRGGNKNTAADDGLVALSRAATGNSNNVEQQGMGVSTYIDADSMLPTLLMLPIRSKRPQRESSACEHIASRSTS